LSPAGWKRTVFVLNTQLETAFTPRAHPSEIRFTCERFKYQGHKIPFSRYLCCFSERDQEVLGIPNSQKYTHKTDNQGPTRNNLVYTNQISTKLLLWGWNAWLLHANAQQKEWPFCILQIRFVKVSRYIGFFCKPTFSFLSTVAPKHVGFFDSEMNVDSVRFNHICHDLIILKGFTNQRHPRSWHF